MEDKQINRWLRQRFTSVGWALTGYFVVMNILAVMAMVFDMAIQQLRAMASGELFGSIDMNSAAGNAWGYVVTVAVGLVVLYAWKGGDFWKTEIFARSRPMNGATFFCLLSLFMGVQMANSLWITLLETVLNRFGKSVMELLESVSGDSDTVSMFFYSAILAPISEEILFRGFALRTLRPYGKRFAIFGSAFLFGIFHGNLLQAPFAFLIGLVLGYAAVEHSIYWAMALHMFNNLVLADLLTRAMRPLPEMAANLIQFVLFGGFTVVAIVMLAVKYREIRAYRQGEWMDRRCLKCFFSNSGIIVLLVLMGLNMISMFFMV